MKPKTLTAIALAVCTGACAKEAGSSTGQTQANSSAGRSVWKEDDRFVSMLGKKQDSSLLRLAQERAAQKAIEEQAAARVPPSMYRTTEPPLPEPDLSLPVADVPRSTPTPTPAASPAVNISPQPGQ
jgi:hypothetical protein